MQQQTLESSLSINLIKENLSEIVLTYNLFCESKDKIDDPAAEFSIAVLHKLTKIDTTIDLKQIASIDVHKINHLKDINKDQIKLIKNLLSIMYDIYNKLSSAYKEKPIPLDEINSYFQIGPTRSFLAYICCCKGRRNADPRFIDIISDKLNNNDLCNNFIITQHGEIIPEDVALHRFIENAM